MIDSSDEARETMTTLRTTRPEGARPPARAARPKKTSARRREQAAGGDTAMRGFAEPRHRAQASAGRQRFDLCIYTPDGQKHSSIAAAVRHAPRVHESRGVRESRE